jgi:hypothetical protein
MRNEDLPVLGVESRPIQNRLVRSSRDQLLATQEPERYENQERHKVAIRLLGNCQHSLEFFRCVNRDLVVLSGRRRPSIPPRRGLVIFFRILVCRGQTVSLWTNKISFFLAGAVRFPR